MNIGIIVHSQTGHTDYAAHKVEEILKKKGLKPEYTKLYVVGDQKRSNKDIKFKEMPDLSAYDLILFGSHVEGFNLAQAMKSYLTNIESLAGKKVICLITQGLPKKWMGAKNALKQMTALLTAKGADVIAAESISWSNNQKREAKMLAFTAEISNLI